MSGERPTKKWSVRDIDRMLDILLVAEHPDFVACRWSESQEVWEKGVSTLTMALPKYHPAVETLWQLCYESSAYIDPYAALPEDPALDGIPFSVHGADFSPRHFQVATVNQIRRYLVLCTRGERFSDGYIANEFESGTIVAALSRLKHLRAAMK